MRLPVLLAVVLAACPSPSPPVGADAAPPARAPDAAPPHQSAAGAAAAEEDALDEDDMVPVARQVLRIRREGPVTDDRLRALLSRAAIVPYGELTDAGGRHAGKPAFVLGRLREVSSVGGGSTALLDTWQGPVMVSGSFKVDLPAGGKGRSSGAEVAAIGYLGGGLPHEVAGGKLVPTLAAHVLRSRQAFEALIAPAPLLVASLAPASAIFRAGKGRARKVPMTGTLLEYLSALVGSNGVGRVTEVSEAPCRRRQGGRCIRLRGEACPSGAWTGAGDCEGLSLTVVVDVAGRRARLDHAIGPEGSAVTSQADVERLLSEAP